MNEMLDKDFKSVPQNITAINYLQLGRTTGNVYKAVCILGKRANQIGGELKAELNEKLSEFSPNTESLEEIQENREQIEIARQYEALPRPTLIAIDEFFHNKLYYKEPTAE